MFLFFVPLSVREATAKALGSLVGTFGTDWFLSRILPQMNILMKDRNYRRRMTILHTFGFVAAATKQVGTHLCTADAVEPHQNLCERSRKSDTSGFPQTKHSFFLISNLATGDFVTGQLCLVFFKRVIARFYCV